MAKLTLEDIEKTRKQMAEANQRKSEEIAKQTNAAPIYNQIPTLEQHYQNKVAQNAQIDTRNVDRAQEAAIKKAARDLKNIQNDRRAQERADEYNNHMATVRARRNNNEILPAERTPRPTTKYRDEIAGQTSGRKRTPYDTEFNDFYEWRFNRADTTDYDPQTDTNIPHWEQVKSDMMKKHKWTEDQFNKYWEQYNNARNQEMADKEVETAKNVAASNVLAGNIMRQAYAPQQMLEGGMTALDSLEGLINRDKLAQSANDPRFTGTRVRETANQTARDKYKTWFGRAVHDFATSLEDMGMNTAFGLGTSKGMGITSGLQSAVRNQMAALERGASPERAALFGDVAGAVSGVMNTIGLNGVFGAEAKTALRTVAKAAGREGAENVSEDLLTMAWDQLINQDASQLQTLHDYYVNNGDDDKTAWKKVIGDTARDLGMSALSGSVFGGFMSAGRNIPALSKEIGNAAYKLPFVDAKNKHYTSEIENLIANNTDEPTRIPQLGDVEENVDWGREGNYKRAEQAEAPKQETAEEKELPWVTPAQPGSLENYRNNRAQMIEAAKAQAQQGNAWEYQRIIDTVNRNDAEMQKNHPDWFDEGGYLKQEQAPAEQASRSYKDLMPEKPYFEAENYKSLSDNVKKVNNEIDNLNNSKKQLEELLTKEIIGNKPEEEWTSQELIDSLGFLGRKPKLYTEEGNRIKESIADIDSRLRELTKQRDEIHEKQRNLKTEASVNQRSNYSFTEPQAATQTDYQGFDITKATHNDEVQDAINSGKAFIAEMSPLEYLQRSAYEIFNDSTLENTIRSANSFNQISEYADAMRRGEKFPILDLRYDTKSGRGQEGLTRALAAYEAGIDKVPVAIIGKPSENPNNTRISDYEFNKRMAENPLTDAEVEDALTNMSSEDLAEAAEIPQVGETQSALLNNPDDLVSQREDLVNRLNTKGLKMNEMFDIQNQIKAIDAELSQSRPDLYEDGKYVGENKPQRYDTTEDMEEENEEVKPQTEVPAEQPKAEAPVEQPKTETPKQTPEQKTSKRQAVSETYKRMADKLDSKSMREIKFDNDSDKAAYNSAKKEFYSALHKLSDTMNTAKDMDSLYKAMDEVEASWGKVNDTAKKGYIDDNSWKNAVKEVKQKFSEGTRGTVIKLPDKVKSDTSLKDSTLREINSHMSTLGGNNYLKFSKNGGTPIDMLWDELVTASGEELSRDTNTQSDMVQQIYDYVGKLRSAETEKVSTDEGIPSDAFWDEFVASTNEAGQRIQMNLQTFAKAKSALEEKLNSNLSEAERTKIQNQINMLDKLSRAMKGKYLRTDVTPEEGSSKSVTNSGSKIDAAYAEELKEAGIDKYWKKSHKQAFTDATELVNNDPDAALDKYMNNKGGAYDGTDYNAIMILQNRLKKARAEAKLNGDTELEAQLTDQLHQLSNTMKIRSYTSGGFIEAAKMWIDTAQGAANVARNKMAQTLDNMPESEQKFFTDAAQEIEDYSNELLKGRDLWEVLKDAERRTDFEHQLAKKIVEVGKQKRIKVSDEMAKKVAHDVADGARMENIARELAAFHEYNFVDIDEDVLNDVEDMMDRAAKMRPGSKDRDKLETAAFKKLADEIYKNGSDWGDRWDAWRYFAMLSKPATDVRNVGSTAIFSGLYDRIANTVAAAIEAPVDASVKGAKWVLNKTAGTNFDTSKGIKRSKTLATLDPTMIKKSYQDVNKNAYTRLKGHKYAYDVSSGIEENKPIHKPGSLANKTLDKAYQVRGDILSAEDMFFKRNKYATSLTGWLKANGYDESIFDAEDRYYDLKEKAELEDLTDSEKAEYEETRKAHDALEKAREYTIKQAKYSTYNAKSDAGKLSVAAKEMRRHHNPAVRMAGRWIDGMMAFKQVPANILKTIYHFSPLSAPQSIGKIAQSIISADDTKLGRIGTEKHHINVGQSTVADAISMASKTLTGTGLMMLGASMYENGNLIPSPNGDRKKADEAEGIQSYSVRVGDKTYTIDWMGTGATPLLLGAEAKRIWDKYHKEDDTFWDTAKGIGSMNANEAVNAALTAFDPVIEMSVMKGAADTLDSIRYSDSLPEAAMAFGATPIIGYYGQGIPTPLGAAARTEDNTRRTLRTNNEGAVGVLERGLRQQYNKLPGLNKKNAPYVDMYGRQENITGGNLAERAAYNFLSPSYIKNVNVEPFQAELDRLYEETGDSEVLGKAFPNKIDGERLTNDEYVAGQTVAGQAWTDLMMAALDNEDYKNLPSDIQNEVQKNLAKVGYEAGVAEVRPDKKISDELYATYNTADPETRLQDVVNEAIEKGSNTVRDTAIKNMGLPANEVTKAYYDENNQEKLNKYKEALNIARKYGRTSISKKEWQTYDVKGKDFFETEIKYANQAKEAGVSDSEDFRNAARTGQVDSYTKAYNAITSTVTGQDDLGNEKHLEYNDTTRQIYDDKDQYGLDQYAYLQKSLPNGFSKSSDRDVINSLRSSSMSKENEAYFFVLHKGDSIAKSAPQPDYVNNNYTDTYLWYLIKDHYNTNGGDLDKDERAELHRDVYDYLVGLGYSKSKAAEVKEWKWN